MTRKPSLIGPWALFIAAIRDFRAHWWPYLLLVAIVAIPTNVLKLFDDLANDSGFSAYSFFAAIFMNVALIYMTIAALNGQRLPSIRQAYYKGSGAVLRFLLASLGLLVVLAPAAFGATLLLMALSAIPGTSPAIAEVLLFAVVSMVLAAPSLWLFIRFGFSTYIVVEDGLAPIQSLRYSWRLTKGRFWSLLGRFAFLLLILIVATALAYLPALLLGLVYRDINALNSLYQIILGLITLPLVNLYLLRLYRELKARQDTQPEAT